MSSDAPEPAAMGRRRRITFSTEVGDAVDDEDARRPHNPRAERIMLKVPVTAMASRVTMRKFAPGSLGGVVMLPVMLGLVFTRESE